MHGGDNGPATVTWRVRRRRRRRRQAGRQPAAVKDQRECEAQRLHWDFMGFYLRKVEAARKRRAKKNNNSDEMKWYICPACCGAYVWLL